jgi:catalase (peroxidase I)
MIWAPFQILRATFAAGPDPAEARAAAAAAAAGAHRWAQAAARTPELRADLIRLGGVLALQPARFEAGFEVREPIDPVRLAYEAGQRDMALRLLALMGTTPETLIPMMEDADHDDA